MEAFADFSVKNKIAISEHWYQLPECGSGAVPGRGPEAQNLINSLAKKSAKKNQGIGKEKADAADVPLWVEETGPTSCPGTNDTSLTNASALWAADYTLYTAQLGVERMVMHLMLGACKGGAPMSLVCDPADHGQRSDTFVPRPNMLRLRLVVPSIGGAFTKTSVKGGGNMIAYTTLKDESTTLVTMIINANDAGEVGSNSVSLKMSKGFAVAKASQVYGPSNNAKSATQVIAANPLPDKVPYSGPKKTGDTDADENVLNTNLVASSATVFIMTKK